MGKIVDGGHREKGEGKVNRREEKHRNQRSRNGGK